MYGGRPFSIPNERSFWNHFDPVPFLVERQGVAHADVVIRYMTVHP